MIENGRDLTLVWPDAERLYTAFMLATDLTACRDLLAGRAVNPERLDQAQVARAQQASLVQLARPIDLLSAA